MGTNGALDRKVFDQVMKYVPQLRAAGSMHDTFETWHLVWEQGGADALYRLFCAVLRGNAATDLIDGWTDLRAVLFFKDESCTDIRPIGIGESIRRLICKCLARQRRKRWDYFLTHMLPEDAAARDAAIAEAEEECRTATTALDMAGELGGGAAACAARSELQQAQQRRATASVPVNFPRNHCFSPDGCPMTALTVQAWMEEAADETGKHKHVLSDDKAKMYQSVERPEMFRALRSRPELQETIPAYRAFYGKPARIFLVRGDGELMMTMAVPRSRVGDEEECMENDGDDGDGDAGVAAMDDEDTVRVKVLRAIRSRKGTQQGDVLGTLGAMTPYHLALHDVCKKYDVDVECLADDTYFHGWPEELYAAFAYQLQHSLSTVGLESNINKLKALAPGGGTEGIPDYILEAQGGEVPGLKVVGTWAAPRTAAADEWRAAQLAAKLKQRLAPLDKLDAMTGSATETDVLQLQYNLLADCADAIPGYWCDTLPPSITAAAVGAAVDERLLLSLDRLTDAADSTPTQRALARQQAPLPTSMGGAKIGGHARRAPARYAATVLKCHPRLAESCPSLRGPLDPGDHPLPAGHAGPVRPRWRCVPMMAEAGVAYETLRAARDVVGTVYETYKTEIYHTIRGGLMSTFRPSKLPRAKTLPPLADVLDPESDFSMPGSRALSMVVHHQLWLECYAAAATADAAKPHTTTRRREATRFVAVSQEDAGGWLDVPPDGTFGTKVTSLLFRIMLQRRLGLNISEASAVCDAEERDGSVADRQGDDLANAGEYTRRHNACLRAIRDMIAAVAIGAVVLGDKEDLARTAMLNEGHAVDVAELGADEETGADVLYEVKCKSALCKKYSAGKGSAALGGQPKSMGHKIGFGNTEEEERVRILGCKKRGRPSDKPMDHATGKGWVAPRKGHYHDALAVKRATVIAAVMESTGGISPPLSKQTRRLAERTKGRGAVDRTNYGLTRRSTRSFEVHHKQRMSLAAVKNDAMAIRKRLLAKKQLLCTAAPAASAFGGSA